MQRRIIIIAVVIVIIATLLILLNLPGKQEGLKAAFNSEFLTRPDGWPGLSEHYGFSFVDEPMHMDPGLMYRAVADGMVDVIDGFSTDGRIPAYDLVILDDDKAFFPPYYAAPLVRADTLEKHRGDIEVLLNLGGNISNETMQRMNYEVDERGRKAYDVAREFLISNGLISKYQKERQNNAGKVVIGSKQFTEQEILGEIVAILLESETDLKVERRLNLGGTLILFNAIKAGDIDIYVEYTGTGLVNILKKDVIADPDLSYEKVKAAFSEKYDLTWLDPLGFNNTYTLTMRRRHAKELGIKSISDLAAYVKNEI